MNIKSSITKFALLIRHPISSCETAPKKALACVLSALLFLPPFFLVHLFCWRWRATHAPDANPKVEKAASAILNPVQPKPEKPAEPKPAEPPKVQPQPVQKKVEPSAPQAVEPPKAPANAALKPSSYQYDLSEKEQLPEFLKDGPLSPNAYQGLLNNSKNMEKLEEELIKGLGRWYIRLNSKTYVQDGFLHLTISFSDSDNNGNIIIKRAIIKVNKQNIVLQNKQYPNLPALTRVVYGLTHMIGDPQTLALPAIKPEPVVISPKPVSSQQSPHSNRAYALFSALEDRINADLAAQWQSNHKTFDFQVVNRFRIDARGTRCIQATQVDSSEKAIHANHMAFQATPNLPFICSQAPLPESTPSFWRSVWNHSSLIIDLTTRKDGIEAYYPDSDEPKTYGDVEVQRVKTSEGQLFSIGHYVIRYQGQEKEIKRLHFRNWPDFGAVEVNEFIELLKAFESEIAHIENTPWIHCRAGVGRTGAVTVGLVIKRLHQEGKLTRENYLDTINGLILEGRRQRDLYFVQSEEQYSLLLKYAEALVLCKESFSG